MEAEWLGKRRISDFGFRISDFGFRISGRQALLLVAGCQLPVFYADISE
jgi:hypothetical protein